MYTFEYLRKNYIFKLFANVCKCHINLKNRLKKYQWTDGPRFKMENCDIRWVRGLDYQGYQEP